MSRKRNKHHRKSQQAKGQPAGQVVRQTNAQVGGQVSGQIGGPTSRQIDGQDGQLNGAAEWPVWRADWRRSRGGGGGRYLTNLARAWHQTRSQLSRGNLSQLAIIYLALPLFLFLLGWLRFYYAIPLVALLSYLLLHWLGAIKTEARLPWRSVLVCIVVATLWVGLGGTGGIGYQFHDYLKHDAVLKALVFQQWPVAAGRKCQSGLYRGLAATRRGGGQTARLDCSQYRVICMDCNRAYR